MRKESNRGHKGWSGESATSFSSDTLSLRSKLFSKIVAGLSPVLLFYIVVNLSSSSFLFLGQNILLLGILVGAYFLLRRGSYDSAVNLLFAGGMLVVQLSFLAGEFFLIEEMPAGWAHFAVVNACLTVLIAAAFSRKRGQLILIDSVMGVTLLTHQVLYILGERGNLPDSLGLVFYFGIAVGFSFLIQALFEKQGILLEDRKRLNHDLEMKNNQLQLFMNSSPDFYF